MYNDWHDAGLYDHATQAQGITLADLIHERMDHNPAITEVNSALQPGDYCCLSDGMLTITNDSDHSWTYSGGALPETALGSGETTMLGGKYPQTIHVDRGSTQVYVRFVDDPPEVWRYGLEYVDLPPDSPMCYAIWPRVSTRVNERYYKRYLAGETLDDWQRLLQVRTDALVPRIERALRLYADNDVDSSVLAGVLTEYLDLTDKTTGGSTSSSNSKYSATPDQSVNESDNYAGQTSVGTSKSTDDRTNTKTGKVRTTQTALGGIIPQLNLSITDWLDLETLLIDGYGSCFMTYIWG